METTQASLYERLGGQDAISAVVDNFYDRMLQDKTVQHFFDTVDMERQRRHQALFLSFALGGPNQYSGQSMAKVHEGMNLQEEHYNAVVHHLGEALRDFKVGETDIQEVVKRIDTLKDDVLHK